jgi:hypothetical protein
LKKELSQPSISLNSAGSTAAAERRRTRALPNPFSPAATNALLKIDRVRNGRWRRLRSHQRLGQGRLQIKTVYYLSHLPLDGNKWVKTGFSIAARFCEKKTGLFASFQKGHFVRYLHSFGQFVGGYPNGFIVLGEAQLTCPIYYSATLFEDYCFLFGTAHLSLFNLLVSWYSW